MLNVIRERIEKQSGHEALETLGVTLGVVKDEQYTQNTFLLSARARQDPIQSINMWTDVNTCGTQACAHGWAVALFDGLQNSEGGLGNVTPSQFFNIGTTESAYLFSDRSGVRTAASALHLPHYMDGKCSEREAAVLRIGKILDRHR